MSDIDDTQEKEVRIDDNQYETSNPSEDMEPVEINTVSRLFDKVIWIMETNKIFLGETISVVECFVLDKAKTQEDFSILESFCKQK